SSQNFLCRGSKIWLQEEGKQPKLSLPSVLALPGEIGEAAGVAGEATGAGIDMFGPPSHHGGIGQGPAGGHRSAANMNTILATHNPNMVKTTIRQALLVFFMMNSSAYWSLMLFKRLTHYYLDSLSCLARLYILCYYPQQLLKVKSNHVREKTRRPHP
ncbi:MAG: hypothetical protein Q8M58_12165, partial [Anaerolineales bacterium]|nr:hypothetical protein [Anaerolineales bacterium]